LVRANPDFAKQLNRIEKAGNLNYCYQCSACVQECPAALRFSDFNPREIVLCALLGVADELIGENSVIWQCATCYNCYERCPQKARPVEVITALKNLAFETGNAPEQITALRESVLNHGTITTLSDSMKKRRDELGVPAISLPEAGLLKKILGG